MSAGPQTSIHLMAVHARQCSVWLQSHLGEEVVGELAHGVQRDGPIVARLVDHLVTQSRQRSGNACAALGCSEHSGST